MDCNVQLNTLELPPRITNALNKARIKTLHQIVRLPSHDLARLLKIANQDVDFLQHLASKRYINPSPITAHQFLGPIDSSNFRQFRVSTGCSVLDNFLGGGISSTGITEIAGESACGKTQLCLQMALSTQLPPKFGGLNKGVAYLCTECLFPSERLQQICVKFRKKFQTEINFVDNIYVSQIGDMETLWKCVDESLPKLLSGRNIGLIVIDSVASIFRAEFDAAQNRERAQKLYKLGSSLHRLNVKYGAAILCINQVTTNIGAGESEIVPALGLMWANVVTTRLIVSRTNKQLCIGTCDDAPNNSSQRIYSVIRNMDVGFSSYLPNRRCQYFINSWGVQGIRSI